MAKIELVVLPPLNPHNCPCVILFCTCRSETTVLQSLSNKKEEVKFDEVDEEELRAAKDISTYFSQMWE